MDGVCDSAGDVVGYWVGTGGGGAVLRILKRGAELKIEDILDNVKYVLSLHQDRGDGASGKDEQGGVGDICETRSPGSFVKGSCNGSWLQLPDQSWGIPEHICGARVERGPYWRQEEAARVSLKYKVGACVRGLEIRRMLCTIASIFFLVLSKFWTRWGGRNRGVSNVPRSNLCFILKVFSYPELGEVCDSLVLIKSLKKNNLWLSSDLV